jgi:hypothetical protein
MISGASCAARSEPVHTSRSIYLAVGNSTIYFVPASSGWWRPVVSTGRDLVAGSGLRFEDRSRHVLKGLPEEGAALHGLRWSMSAP